MGLESYRLTAEPLRSLGFAAISGAYSGIGTRLAYPSRLLYINNITNALLFFSLDGITDHLPLGSGSFTVIDIMANHSISNLLYIAEGQRFYVRAPGTLPTLGSVYVSSFYSVEI